MPIRIANGAGFLGDNLDAPRRLVEAAEVDVLTIEHLAELTMSILAHQRAKDPRAGYATDFLDVIDSLLPALRTQPQLHLIANSGGMNPTGCAAATGRALAAADLGDLTIGIVRGDDILARLDEWRQAGCSFRNLDTGADLAELQAPIVSANAYLGAAPIVDALSQNARIVITGRVADASLTVAPVVHRYGWSWEDWNRLAGASVAGHLIECGAQVTGGYATEWSNCRLTDVGYPIAEVDSDGSCQITKPPGSGGVVNRRTVVEQLTYEIGDPQQYLTPDVDVDFTTVTVHESGTDRVVVQGANGGPRPDCLKVSLAYRAGYMASAQLLVYGEDCLEKAQAAAQMVLDRVALAGFQLERSKIETLGTGCAVPLGQTSNRITNEVILRVAVHDSRRDAVERFTREFAPLITSGPAGLAGYAAGRSPVRPVIAYWPTLVPRELVRPQVMVLSAKEWAES
jgi:hypothetical protein